MKGAERSWIAAPLDRAYDSLTWLILLITVVMLTRQAQLASFNALMLGAVACIALCGWKAVTEPLVSITIVYLVVCALIGLIGGADPADTLRFFAILTFSLLAFAFKPTHKPGLRTLLLCGLVQAAIIISIGVYLGLNPDPLIVGALRAWATADSSMGEIYSFDDVFYRVQLIGNALIPFFFFLTVQLRKQSPWMFAAACIFGLALIFTGNLTYWVAGLMFMLYQIAAKASQERVLLAMLLSLALALLLGGYFQELLSLKFLDNDGSMGIRFDQLSSLFARAEHGRSGY